MAEEVTSGPVPFPVDGTQRESIEPSPLMKMIRYRKLSINKKLMSRYMSKEN